MPGRLLLVGCFLAALGAAAALFAPAAEVARLLDTSGMAASLPGFAPPLTQLQRLLLASGIFLLILLLTLLAARLFARRPAADAMISESPDGFDLREQWQGEPDAVALVGPLPLDPPLDYRTDAPVPPETPSPAEVSVETSPYAAPPPDPPAAIDTQALVESIDRLEKLISGLPKKISAALVPKDETALAKAVVQLGERMAAGQRADPQLVRALERVADTRSGDLTALNARLDRLMTQFEQLARAQQQIATHLAMLAEARPSLLPSDAQTLRLPASPRLTDAATAQRLARALADLRKAADTQPPL